MWGVSFAISPLPTLDSRVTLSTQSLPVLVRLGASLEGTSCAPTFPFHPPLPPPQQTQTSLDNRHFQEPGLSSRLWVQLGKISTNKQD